jgi:hypothetical protein
MVPQAARRAKDALLAHMRVLLRGQDGRMTP